MGRSRHIRIFASSPCDVADERRELKAVVDELAPLFSRKGITLELLTWETHSYPSLESPQVAINRQIGSYDIFVGVMWKRFGTPTATAGSGTEEEFRTAHKLWEQDRRRPVLFYFSEKPYLLSSREDIEQLAKVMSFKHELTATMKAFVSSYPTKERPDFASLVRPHLTQAIEDYLSAVEDQERTVTAQEPETSPPPVSPFRVPATLFAVHVADYSGQPEYLREEILEKLCQGSGVSPASIPVIDETELKQRDPTNPTVSIHLFDGSASTKEYELLECGLKHAAWQIIWAPKGLDVSQPLNGRTTLAALAASDASEPPHQFTRLAARDAAEDLVARVVKLEQQWRLKHARCVLLDVNRKDTVKVKELIEYLDARGIQRATLRPYDDPGLINFDDALVKSKVLVFVSGQVGQHYVQGRLLCAANRLSALRHKIHKVSVYGAPPERQPRDAWRFEPPIPITIKFIDNTTGFDPAELPELLADLMEGNQHEAAS
jgi:Domain of unknown function (DUF4062)